MLLNQKSLILFLHSTNNIDIPLVLLAESFTSNLLTVLDVLFFSFIKFFNFVSYLKSQIVDLALHFVFQVVHLCCCLFCDFFNSFTDSILCNFRNIVFKFTLCYLFEYRIFTVSPEFSPN